MGKSLHRSHRPDADRQWRQFNRNYIVIYEEDKAAQVAEIVEEDMHDSTMWKNSLLTSQKELRDEPDDAFLWFNLGRSYTALEQHTEAAEAFDQARAIGLPWRMLWYLFSPYEAYYQSGRFQDVILLADTTLNDRPYFEESFYYKALAMDALGDLDGARQNMEKAVNFNPNFSESVEVLTKTGIQFETGKSSSLE